jgi:hypothetical protein
MGSGIGRRQFGSRNSDFELRVEVRLIRNPRFAIRNQSDFPLLRAEARMSMARCDVEELHGSLHAFLEGELAALSKRTAGLQF